MPCDTVDLTAESKQRQAKALEKLDLDLLMGNAQVVIGAQGSIAFRGWQEREGLADLCAYRRLTAGNSPGLRRALARAEALAGRKVNAQAVAAGVHSHDGGATWSRE